MISRKPLQRLLLFMLIIIMSVTSAHAQLKLNIGNSKQKFTILPQRPGLNMANLIFVDLNHDGKDDLLVGGDASYGGDNIASFFVLMSDKIRPENSPYNLATQPADRRYNAAEINDFSDFTRLAKGDWNADGREDAAIAGLACGPANEGAVHILLGSDTFGPVTGAQTLGASTVDIYLQGKGPNTGLGSWMQTADVNGDHIDDLVVADTDSLYVLFGGPSFASRHNTGISSSNADFTISSWEGGYYGKSLGAGDINHDGRDDIFLGNGNTNWVYLSKPSFANHAVINRSTTTADITTLNYGGWTGGSNFGSPDLNGDGTKDLIVIDDGGFKALWGRSAWDAPKAFDLATTHDLKVVYEGYYGGDTSDVGDINNDGIDDIAIGEEYDGKIEITQGRNFSRGTVLDYAHNLARPDILLYNGGYHFSNGVFGRVIPGEAMQVGGGAWAEGSNYAGIIQICFMRPDVNTLSFQPASPKRGENLTVNYLSGWESGQTIQCRWFVNGTSVQGEAGTLLPGSYYKRADVVRVELTATLPGYSTAKTTGSISTTVLNTPPTAPTNVSITPSNPLPDQDLTAIATKGTDVDGDTVSLAYRWTVSGVVKGSTSKLSHTLFVPGDTVQLDVWCNDSFGNSSSQRTQVVIQNSPTAKDNASVVSIDMPKKVMPGVGFYIRVTAKNTGQTAWYMPWGYQLNTGTPNPPYIYPGQMIRPGDTYEFNRYCSGYPKVGNYTYIFQMERTDKGLFGSIKTQDVQVKAAEADREVWALY